MGRDVSGSQFRTLIRSCGKGNRPSGFHKILEFLSSLAVVSEEVCSLELFGSTAGRNESHAGSE
jgi:hypothetical protein